MTEYERLKKQKDEIVAKTNAKITAEARAALARKLVEAVGNEHLADEYDRWNQAYNVGIRDALAAMARVLAEENIELGLVEELRKP